MPSPEQKEKLKNRIDIIPNPLYVIQQGRRGECHGPEEWQYHHWKARGATTNVINRGHKIIAKRWIKDPCISRNSTGTWMDSRVLHVLGRSQNSRNRLQGYLGRQRSLPGPVRTEAERRKEPRKDVSPR